MPITTTTKEIISAIRKGATNANRTYSKWTGGAWVSDYGVESFMVSEICRSIDRKRDTGYISMEEPFKDLIDSSGKKTIGRRPDIMNGLQRVDIALWNETGNVTHVIEVKRKWTPACRDDLDRLIKLHKKLTTVQCGIFAMYVEVEGDKSKLERKLKGYEKTISEDLHDSQIRFHYDSTADYTFSEGEYLGTCLCVEIYGRN